MNVIYHCFEMIVSVFVAFSVIMQNLAPRFHSAVSFTKKYCGITMVQWCYPMQYHGILIYTMVLND